MFRLEVFVLELWTSKVGRYVVRCFVVDSLPLLQRVTVDLVVGFWFILDERPVQCVCEWNSRICWRSGERNEQQPERYRRKAVKALGTLAVAERDILGRFAHGSFLPARLRGPRFAHASSPSDSARSDDATSSRAHLALSVHQEYSAPHASPTDCAPHPSHSVVAPRGRDSARHRRWSVGDWH